MADNDNNDVVSPPTNNHYALSGKIMLAAIIILLFIVILMICLHLYVRLHLLRSNRRHIRRRRIRRTDFVFSVDRRTANATSRGLPESVVKSLPVFVYSSEAHRHLIDCAVCLSEFEEHEIGRVIPKCNHCFHVGCIDMWLSSHSTCPLCRSMVEPVCKPDDPDRPEPGSGFGHIEFSSAVELVVVSADVSGADEGFRRVGDEASGHGTSKRAMEFVKSLSFKRILSRDKREADSPSTGNDVVTMPELDVESRPLS